MDYIVTHTDLDGVGSYLMLKQVANKDHDVVFSDYKEAHDAVTRAAGRMNKGDTLYIADLAFEKEFIERVAACLGEMGCALYYFDHHPQSVKSLLYTRGHWGRNKCATLIIQEYFNLPWTLFAQSVDAWDTWKLDSEYRQRGEELNTLLDIKGRERFILSVELRRGMLSNTDHFLLELERERKQEYISQVGTGATCHYDRNNRVYALVYAERYSSDLGHFILSTIDVDYVRIVNFKDRKVSLRSRTGSDIDVGKIAKEHGGGGHKHSAGYPIPHTEKFIL